MDSDAAREIDIESAHSARIYDYILGGKDYYPADQQAGDAMVRAWPALPVHMRANRDFMNRAVRHLAEEAGTRQFLDIGTGIPTSPGMPMRLRTLAEAGQFFEGLELVEPGIVQVHRWRPEGTDSTEIRDEDIAMYGAVARTPG
ncbi:hypothetical protein F7R91_04655 [Streptomyces luteolifulvus]|uniref:Methyltransferase n=1 Tax=Streptomyces luteolifulvus TaxID=2615112 RepID=A0A6H9V9W7_9ACTN|nr:SAM-dependent methyltransferase [Streptomyces luteolifulvus]KAB1150099.1 hypothetical protein F7R91_04655 [Streptomyces luteolifulvus]